MAAVRGRIDSSHGEESLCDIRDVSAGQELARGQGMCLACPAVAMPLELKSGVTLVLWSFEFCSEY